MKILSKLETQQIQGGISSESVIVLGGMAGGILGGGTGMLCEQIMLRCCNVACGIFFFFGMVGGTGGGMYITAQMYSA